MSPELLGAVDGIRLDIPSMGVAPVAGRGITMECEAMSHGLQFLVIGLGATLIGYVIASAVYRAMGGSNDNT